MSANSTNDALKHVQHAIAYLRKFERRLMRVRRRWVLGPKLWAERDMASTDRTMTDAQYDRMATLLKPVSW